MRCFCPHAEREMGPEQAVGNAGVRRHSLTLTSKTYCFHNYITLWFMICGSVSFIKHPSRWKHFHCGLQVPKNGWHSLFLWLQGLPHHTTAVLWWRGSSWLSLHLSRSFWWNAEHGKAPPCYFLFIREEIHVLCQKYEATVISKKVKMKRCALWKSGSVWKFSTPWWAHLEGSANPLGFTCIF